MSLSLLILVQSCNIISIAAIIIKLCPNNGSSKRRPNLRGKQVFSHVKMISLTSSLSLKLYLNSLVYHRNIFESSSKVFGNIIYLRTSSEIPGKCSGTFVWPSEQFWKIFGNLPKVVENFRKIVKNAVVSISI